MSFSSAIQLVPVALSGFRRQRHARDTDDPSRFDDESSGKVSVGESVPVSAGGGFSPRWRGDGSELFYLKLDGSVMAVDVKPAAGTFSLNPAKRLFTALGVFPEWGVTRDGSRLLFAVPTAPAPPLTIIQNWQSALPN